MSLRLWVGVQLGLNVQAEARHAIWATIWVTVGAAALVAVQGAVVVAVRATVLVAWSGCCGGAASGRRGGGGTFFKHVFWHGRLFPPFLKHNFCAWTLRAAELWYMIRVSLTNVAVHVKCKLVQ